MTRGRCSVTCESDKMSVTHACCAVRSPLYFDFLSHWSKRVVHVPRAFDSNHGNARNVFRPKSIFNAHNIIWHHRSKLLELQLRPRTRPTFPAPFIESSLRLISFVTSVQPRLIYAFTNVSTNQSANSLGKSFVSFLSRLVGNNSIYSLFLYPIFRTIVRFHGGDQIRPKWWTTLLHRRLDEWLKIEIAWWFRCPNWFISDLVSRNVFLSVIALENAPTS